MELEDADRLVSPRPSYWPVVVVVGLLAAGGAAALLWPRPPDPTKVLVVTTGCSERCAGAMFVGLTRTLHDGGFELVRPDATPPDAESARRAAHEAGAEHALWIVVSVHERRAPGPIDPAYASASARATLLSVTGEPPIEAASPRIAAHRADVDVAIARAAEQLAAPLADAIHLALLERASTRAFASDPDVDAALRARHATIGRLLPRVERVHQERGWMRDSCEEAAAVLERDDAAEVRCLSDACAEEYAFGATPDGRAALVHVETPAARIPLGGRSTAAVRVESEERIELVPLDGSERRVIARADNYYTYPALSADGSRIVAIEEWDAGFGMIALDVASGARTVLARFDRQYPQGPELSPDGRYVLYRLRASRRAPAQLVASPVRADAPMMLLGEAHIGAWSMLDGRALVAELVDLARLSGTIEEAAESEPSELPALEEWARRLALFDPGSGEVRAWLDDDRHRVEQVAGSHQGRVLFTWSNGDTCGAGAWDARSGEASFVRTEICVRSATVAPDGTLIGTAAVAVSDPAAGDDELVQLDLDDGTHRVLTANGLRERYPRAVGRRVVFDRVGEMRYRRFPRVATCWLEQPD